MDKTCKYCESFQRYGGFNNGNCKLNRIQVNEDASCLAFCEIGSEEKEAESNNIKPSHYKAGKFDVIAFCQEHDLSFDIGNIIKYCTRAGKKEGNSELQDLNKAMEYLKRRIEFVGGKEECK